MKIETSRRRRPAVPIITLIDILAILLIFFIVTTTFKEKESLIQVNLPRSSELEGSASGDLRVVLALTETGEVSLGEEIVSLQQLPQKLQQFQSQNPSAELELKADEGAPLGRMVDVWDAATKAGLEIDDLPLRILIEN
ncbi:MAG: biopolymer transporter ExbD [Verrucomicrobiota bacterium]